MRIRIYLTPVDGRSATIPINYQYPLSATIYRILHEAAPAYAEFLHQSGYRSPVGRLMKLFTFSKLWIPDVRIVNGRGLTGSEKPWKLQIGSPFQDEFVQNVVRGLFFQRRLVLAAEGFHAEFEITRIEVLPKPKFLPEMKFKCLSPITVSTGYQRGDKFRALYLSPEDPRFSELVRKNLLQKYEILHGKQPEDGSLQFRVLPNARIRSRLIAIKSGTPEETRIRAFETHFLLQGNPDLMEVAWECGIGEHNSQGFGMIEPRE